jgi:hypothetical protein
VLASPVALIDPELIILAGDIGTAGGDELAEEVRARLHETLAHRPRVVAGTGYDNSVRQGALDAALRRLRESVFEDSRDHRKSLRNSTETAMALDPISTGPLRPVITAQKSSRQQLVRRTSTGKG